MLNGFQPDAAIKFAFWRLQGFDSLNRVTNETYLNFGATKWFKTHRVMAPLAGSQGNEAYFWFDPKEQNEIPDLTVLDPSASSLFVDLDNIWAGTGTTTGFQPDSAIDAAYWRYQYPQSGNFMNEVYVNMDAVKRVETVRVNPPVIGGQVNTVFFWFNTREKDYNPDLRITGDAATKFLADMDAIWAN